MGTALLIIDPQVDFCDPAMGALYVPGADADMERLGEMIGRIGDDIDKIFVTLDSHHYVHIAHPIFWVDTDGHHPGPFTVITSADLENARWKTTVPAHQARALDYVRSLERTARFSLMVWPYHCLIGSAGHAVAPVLFGALQQWESRFAVVEFVSKGSSLWTEHYSAIRAEVPDADDPSTETNTDLIDRLREFDTILVAGEAGSHCVANTVADIADGFGHPDDIAKLVLLTDAMSPVQNFEQAQANFVRELTRRGMRTATTLSPLTR